DKSLVFPNSSAAMPLISESEAGNAPIPSASERAAKRRRTDAKDSAGLFLGGDGHEGAAEQPITVKPEESEEAAAALLESSAGLDVDTNQGFYDPMEEPYLRSAQEIDEEEQQLKPQLRVKVSLMLHPQQSLHDLTSLTMLILVSYCTISVFRVQNVSIQVKFDLSDGPSLPSFYSFGKMLVVVIEPSKSVIADNPDLFGAAPPAEVRQLSVTPMPGGPAGRASSTGARARTQSRLTSVRPPSTTPAPGASRSAREGSRRDSRAPSPGIGATLFLDTPTPEPESRRFGSRGVSRAMSATPGPGSAYQPIPRTHDGSPGRRSNVLSNAINQRSTQNVRKLPPVPNFFDNGEEQAGSTADRQRTRQSQALSPAPEEPIRPRASSILPRQADPLENEFSFGDDDDNLPETVVGIDLDFRAADEEEQSGHFGEDDDEDDDHPPTGLALATQMMEAGETAGQRGTE
ncbi:hypothetical protein CF319_g4588, partial [Tilletia indica]